MILYEVTQTTLNSNLKLQQHNHFQTTAGIFLKALNSETSSNNNYLKERLGNETMQLFFLALLSPTSGNKELVTQYSYVHNRRSGPPPF